MPAQVVQRILKCTSLSCASAIVMTCQYVFVRRLAWFLLFLHFASLYANGEFYPRSLEFLRILLRIVEDCVKLQQKQLDRSTPKGALIYDAQVAVSASNEDSGAKILLAPACCTVLGLG